MQIRQYHANFGSFFHITGHSFSSLGGSQSSISMRFQYPLHHRAHSLLIIDDQDQFTTSSGKRFSCSWLGQRRVSQSRFRRKINPELSALSQFSVELNMSSVTFHYPQ